MPHDPDLHMMSFGDHLEDLRKRLFWALLGPVPIIIVCFVFGERLLDFLLIPVEQQLREAGQPMRLQATSPLEPFAAYLKVAITVGILAAGPWILYQFWIFIAPGLHRHERRFVYFLIPMSAVLTAVAAIFLYSVLLPVSLGFLIRFGAGLAAQQTPIAELPPEAPFVEIPSIRGDPTDPAPSRVWINEHLQELRFAIPTDAGGVRILGAPLTAGGAIAQQYRVMEYVNLVFALGIVFAVAFQLPLVMLLLGWTGIATPESFRGKRRYVLFGCVVSGAVLTPADPISMTLLAAPLYGLFELGILMMRFATARRVAAGLGARRSGADDESER